MSLWHPVDLPPNTPHRWTLGPVTIFARRSGDEVQLATRRADDPEADAEALAWTPVEPETADGVDWSRHVSRHDPCRIAVQPLMPDRPVVARPAEPVALPAGESAVFFVSIPVWLRIEVQRHAPVTLMELPSLVLSNTWFGDPMAGDLCYALRTRARRDPIDLHDRPHRVVCPVHVANRTHDPLNIERLCVHVAYLNIYTEENGRLWNQRVNIAFRGKDRISDVTYGSSVPEAAGSASLVTPAREKHEGRNLLRRSLLSVREVFQL